jgi:protoporphyrinogen/coproporphyrinogen III oxidase
VTEPLWRGVATSAAREFFRPRNYPTQDGHTPDDESLYDTISRRFGPDMADNVVSALVHGIYAGDLRNLSSLSIFPHLARLERSGGGIVSGSWKTWGRRYCKVALIEFLEVLSRHERDRQDHAWEAAQYMQDLRQRASVISFKNGLETIVRELEAKFRQRSNIKIKLNTPVKSILLPTGLKSRVPLNLCFW